MAMPSLLNGQVKAGQGSKAMWETLGYLIGTFLKGSLHEQEAEALKPMVECGKAGDAAIKARAAFEVKKDITSKEFADMIRAWNRYVRAVDASASAPRPKLTNSNFTDIVSKDDAVILQAWVSASSHWSKKLLDGAINLDLSMEAGLGWKDELAEGLSVEEIAEKADSTLMSVKGRKLTTLKDALLEAGTSLLLSNCFATAM